MLWVYPHPKTRTEEGAPRMTSWSEHDEGPADGPYVHHRLVDDAWRDPQDPSQCDRAAIVLGQRTDRDAAADPSRAGGWREGPAESWWRSYMSSGGGRDQTLHRRVAGGRHRDTRRHGE